VVRLGVGGLVTCKNAMERKGSGIGGCSKGLALNGSQLLRFNRNKVDRRSIPEDRIGILRDLVEGDETTAGQGCLAVGRGCTHKKLS